jgi:hypothetical protein
MVGFLRRMLRPFLRSGMSRKGERNKVRKEINPIAAGIVIAVIVIIAIVVGWRAFLAPGPSYIPSDLSKPAPPPPSPNLMPPRVLPGRSQQGNLSRAALF